MQEDEVSVSEQGLIPEPDWDLTGKLHWIKVVGSRVAKWAWSWWVEPPWEVSERAVVDCFDP